MRCSRRVSSFDHLARAASLARTANRSVQRRADMGHNESGRSVAGLLSRAGRKGKQVASTAAFAVTSLGLLD
jgi:hypothetical protein